jgi:hypothetical protein
MRKLIVLTLVFLPFVITAQVKNVCEKANAFNQIQIYDGIIVTLERSEENELCPGIDTDLDKLQITVADGILRIRKIPGTKYENAPQLKVKYLQLTHIEAYGKADIDAPKLIISDSLSITLKSGSRFYGSCDVKYFNALVTEGSLLKIDGYAITQDIQVNSKATFSGFKLIGEDAQLKATTGGTIKVYIENNISGSSTTGGYIGYMGSPKMDVKTSVGGKIVASDD